MRFRFNEIRTASALVIASVLTFGAHASATGIDRPMAVAWPAAHEWNSEFESQYGSFVAVIGRAVAEGRCRTLAGCINDPQINPLLERGSRPLRFRADCADVPYILRAFFAYRHQLPFAYARGMNGRGHDGRYLSDARADGLRTWTEFPTPRALFEQIGSDVHSGYFRTAANVETSDVYPAAINRVGIHPGTMFYDPNGHVLVVYEIRDNGDVMFFDGHPDNSMSHPRFSDRQVLGGARQGGGFKNFRPISWQNGVIVQTHNNDIPLYGGVAQYQRVHRCASGTAVTYEAWVRALLVTETLFAPATPPASFVRSSHARPRTNCGELHFQRQFHGAASSISHRPIPLGKHRSAT